MKLCPITPKTIFYPADGSGRDTYIQADNGGFSQTPLVQLPTKYELGTFKSPSQKKLFKSPSIEAKHLHYHNDGTGRDGYIKWGDGGLTQTEPKRSKNFITNLRYYDQQRQPREDDFFTRLQFREQSTKQLFEMRQRSLQQIVLNQRLAQPKPDKRRLARKELFDSNHFVLPKLQNNVQAEVQEQNARRSQNNLRLSTQF